MKNYVIYLPEFQNSCQLAFRALKSANALSWNLELYEGVNGNTLNWNSTGLKINPNDPKCRSMMERPGVRGCFMSHFKLWEHCVNTNTIIGIFEHDIEFVSTPDSIENFQDILKLEGFLKKKPRPAGEWYEGARAYFITPQGANKLISWVKEHGALPTDVCIGLNVVDIKLDLSEKVIQHPLFGKTDKRENSFTWNLEGMV